PRSGYYSPDCDTGAIAIPVPAGATIEGQAGTTCNFSNEDCHYLVVQGTTLFEVYGANKSGSSLQAQCLVRWDLGATYPPEGRGDHCTSADGAGSRVFDQTANAQAVALTDFEIIDTGDRIAETYDCVRAPAPSAILFANGFE